MNLAQKIFSVKNDDRKTHKIITIAGVKFKIKRGGIKNFKQKIEDYKIMHDPSLYIGIPDDITLQLCFNNDCNCQCKFCANYKYTAQKRIVIPDKWLYKYFEPIYKKTKNLVPTYGEITHGKEGFEYLSYISEKFPHINIFVETNGILFDKKWRELACDNLFSVNFSVNAIDEKSFKDTVWEKDGVFTVVKRNIQDYINLLEEKGLSAFKPSISSVLNSTNYHNVEEFIKMGLKWKLVKVVFMFDIRENNISKLSVKDKENFEKALMTLLELEKLLENKIRLGFRLYMPFKNVDEYEKVVNETPIETLKEKYSEIWDLAKDIDIKKTYLERVKAYKAKNKNLLTYFEFLTGVCWHQKVYKGNAICENPWNHIRLKPDGKLEVCAWRGYRESYKIQQFIENNTINFEKLFNDLFHRKLRKLFAEGNYCGCMKNCPAMQNLSGAEFNEKYCCTDELVNTI